VTSPWRQLHALGTELENTGTVAGRQEAWLMNCLRQNSSSEYGQRHNFARIECAAEFRNQVPVISYEDIAPDIRRMYNGEADVLFSGMPVAFERTGGSTSGSKLIPYSHNSLKDFQAALLPWLANTIEQFVIASGTAYFSISPATRQAEISPGGVRIGLPDGAYLGDAALEQFAAISSVPAWVGSVAELSQWQLATLYYLSTQEDLALISVWSPTFFLMLLDALERRSVELETLLRDGGRLAGQDLPRNPDALARFSRFLAHRRSEILWPNLKLVSCWSDASSRPFFDRLRQRLPHASFQGKGLLSTEGVVSIPNHAGQPLLAMDSGFFEFMDQKGDLHLAAELETGKRYETVITTSGGLYRYRSGDWVTCEGFAEDIPIFRFSGRRGLTCDMVGEKLTEEFVLSCLEDIPGFRILVPAPDSPPGYALVVDKLDNHEPAALIRLVEARLSKNPQYAFARKLGQLDRLLVYSASQPLENYVKRFVTAGARIGDVKVTALRPETDWLETFSGTAS
jgi:hypothetical protein